MIRKIMAISAGAIILASTACSPQEEDPVTPLGASRPHPVEIDSGLEDKARNTQKLIDYLDHLAIIEAVEYVAAVEAQTPPPTTTPPTTTPPATNPPSTPPTTPPTTEAPAPSGDIWWALAGCETGHKYDNPNTGNGYYGYFQFSLPTWQSVGGPGYPHHHSYETQKHYAQILQQQAGWGQWPACSAELGLR